MECKFCDDVKATGDDKPGQPTSAAADGPAAAPPTGIRAWRPRPAVALAIFLLGAFVCGLYLFASWRAAVYSQAQWVRVGATDAEGGGGEAGAETGGEASGGEGSGLVSESAPAPRAWYHQYLLLSNDARIRAMCVGFLCVQYAAYALLRRYATGILKEDWSMASVLGAGELIKFCISLAAIRARDGASEAPPGPLPDRLRYLIRNSGKMAVPAVLYLAMNMLGFVSLRRVDAGTFAVIQQTKAFFTALFARALLGRTLSLPKWCALTVLILAVTLISLQAQPSDVGCGPASARRLAEVGRALKGGHATKPTLLPATPPPAEAAAEAVAEASSLSAAAAAAAAASSYVVGVAAVTADSALSGYATVYFERVLKTTVLTVWDRNLQLAFWSMLIYFPWAVYNHPTAPLHGWSMVTVILALLGALGGILVALVIKHADGLAKALSTASSIVLTTAASFILFDGPMSSAIICGSCIVIVAGYMYQKVP